MSGPPRLCQSSGTFKVPQKAAGEVAGEVAHRLRTCEPTRRLADTPEPGAAPRTAALAVRVIKSRHENSHRCRDDRCEQEGTRPSPGQVDHRGYLTDKRGGNRLHAREP